MRDTELLSMPRVRASSDTPQSPRPLASSSRSRMAFVTDRISTGALSDAADARRFEDISALGIFINVVANNDVLSSGWRQSGPWKSHFYADEGRFTSPISHCTTLLTTM